MTADPGDGLLPGGLPGTVYSFSCAVIGRGRQAHSRALGTPTKSALLSRLRRHGCRLAHAQVVVHGQAGLCYSSGQACQMGNGGPHPPTMRPPYNLDASLHLFRSVANSVSNLGR